MKLPETLPNTDDRSSISHLYIPGLVACCGLIVVFCAVSFYFSNGYIDIGEDKYRAFLRTASIAVPVWIVVWGICSIPVLKQTGPARIIAYFGPCEWLIAAYVVSCVISTLTSEFRDVSVHGQPGWNMGLITQLLMAGIWLMARDTVRHSPAGLLKTTFNILLVISAIVFILGTINRYSIYPIHMMGEAEDFISTIGNINWFTGYWCIWYALGCGAFLTARRLSARILYGIYVWLCAMAGVSSGSASAYLVWLGIGFAALLSGLSDMKRMERLCIMEILQLCALPAIRFIGWLRPDRMWYDSELLRGFTYGDTWIMPFVGGVVFFALLRELFARRKSDLAFLRPIIIGLTLGLTVAMIVIIVINTVIPGGIWPVRGMSVFTWGVGWGNSRGGIWIATIRIIGTMLPLKIFFGTGCDCFCVYAYSMSDITVMLNRYIGNQYLTCAHNELLTVLVNQGIFGVAAYAGLMVSHIRKSIPRTDHPGLILAMSAYIAIGMVGFMQILSTPAFFAVMGVVAGLKDDTLIRVTLESEGMSEYNV